MLHLVIAQADHILKSCGTQCGNEGQGQKEGDDGIPHIGVHDQAHHVNLRILKLVVQVVLKWGPFTAGTSMGPILSDRPLLQLCRSTCLRRALPFIFSPNLRILCTSIPSSSAKSLEVQPFVPKRSEGTKPIQRKALFICQKLPLQLLSASASPSGSALAASSSAQSK